MKVFAKWSGDSRDVITLAISRTSKAAKRTGHKVGARTFQFPEPYS
jgi:hypothetical protein